MVQAIRKSTFPKPGGGQTETSNDCAIIKPETFQPPFRHAGRLCNALGTTHANALRTSGEFAPGYICDSGSDLLPKPTAGSGSASKFIVGPQLGSR